MRSGVGFEPVVISEQRERWLAAGSPPVPTLVLDGVPTCSSTRAAAALLGLEPPPAFRDAREVASDVDAVVDAWLELAEATPWDVLTAPGVVLGRTPLALAGRRARRRRRARPAPSGPVGSTGRAIPAAGRDGRREHRPYEASVVATHRRPQRPAWRSRSTSRAAGEPRSPSTTQRSRATRRRPVRTPRGELALVELLEAQRLHAAGHYRQATASLAAAGDGAGRSTSRRCTGSCSPESLL